MKQGMYNNKPNNEYHQDDGFYSSSQLKVMLNDPILFHKKYILKKIPKEEKDCYDVGNAFHTKILEPKLYDKEYTNFTGKMKRGKDWDAFKEKNKGKIILGNKQQLEVENLVEAIGENKDALGLLKGGKSEVSIYVEMLGVKIKVRFDKLNLEGNAFSGGVSFGADPKSTTGLLIGRAGTYKCKQTIAMMDYDLSAALYMDAANLLLAKIAKMKGIEFKPIKKWYWIFASKDFPSCKVLEASPAMLENGRKKYKLAIEALKECQKSNWELKSLEEGIEVIDPIDSDLLIEELQGKVASW